MKKEHNTYDVYYDEEGDFLEITFGVPPEREYADEIEEGVFITKDEDSGEIKGIGILSFKKRVGILKRVLEKMNMRFPLEISVN